MRYALLSAAALSLVFAASGCFNPSYPQNLSCGDDGECPPGQRCDEAQGICVGEDGSGEDPDAGDTQDPDGGVDNGGFDASTPSDAAPPDASVDECTPQQEDECAAFCEENNLGAPICTPGDCDCEAGDVELAFEGQSLPCVVPAKKVEVADFGREQRGLAGITDNQLLFCANAFEGEPTEAGIEGGAEDVWVGQVDGERPTPEIVVSTAEGFVYVVRVGDAQLDEQVIQGDVRGRSFVTGFDFEETELTDLLIASEAVFRFFQTDPGVFEAGASETEFQTPQNAIFTDVTGDGRPDIASLAGPGSDVSVVTHDYSAEREVILAVEGETSGALTASRAGPEEFVDIVVDVAEGVVLFRNTGDSIEPLLIEIDINGPLAAGDLNGDGAEDLVGVDAEGRGGVFLRDGDDFVRDATFELPVFPESFTLDDLDEDERTDILAATEEEVLFIRQVTP